MALIALDPAGASLELFLVFVFPISRSRPATIDLARQAEDFAEGEVQGRPSFFAGFGKSPDQAHLALEMLRRLRAREYVDQYAGGRRLDGRFTDDVIRCFTQARRCGDTRAHCVTIESRHALFVDTRAAAIVYDELLEDLGAARPPQRYRFPCSYLRGQNFQLNTDHPSDLVSQIQGAAGKHGCDWCPLFRAAGFEKITPTPPAPL